MSAPIRSRTVEAFTDAWAFYRALPIGAPRVLLESARQAPVTGRYSVCCADPFLIFRYEKGCVHLTGPERRAVSFATRDPLGALKTVFSRSRPETSPGLPPFAGGAIGYLSYECKDELLPRTASRHRASLALPQMYFLFFDRAVVWDHRTARMTFCGAGDLKKWEDECRRAVLGAQGAPSRLHGDFPGQEAPMDIRFSMRRDEYEQAVRQAQRRIREGEIFQANLSHRLEFDLPCTAREAYARLRAVNPSPFFGLLETGDFEIVSGSPERLLKLSGRTLQTRPIAGTRRRGSDAKKDEALSMELLLSEKERAEHVMLVDLERNDLGRVSEYGSVRVDELMALENYSHVKHIVSNVRGVLREGLDAFDALGAFFPGGTITGTPKIRSMQVIDELETAPRGPYTGSLGYFSFTGDMDFNILIRSLVVKDGVASLHVGAGIVADSDPEREYDETLYKAEAVLEAVFGRGSVRELLGECGVAARFS